MSRGEDFGSQPSEGRNRSQPVNNKEIIKEENVGSNYISNPHTKGFKQVGVEIVVVRIKDVPVR